MTTESNRDLEADGHNLTELCEKCWADAYDFGNYGGCRSQYERYLQILKEYESALKALESKP